MFSFLKNFVVYSYRAARRFFAEQYTYRVSALAFTTLLALVPLIMVSVFFVSLFPIFSKMVLLAEDYIVENFIPSSSQAIQFYFEGFIKQSSKLPTVSLFFLFITATLLINTIEETLNDIWNVKMSRAAWFAVLVYWCVLLLTPIIVGFSVFLSTTVLSVSWIKGTTASLGMSKFILECVPIAINTLLFSLLYIAIPSTKVGLKEGLSGGFLAAILFEFSRIIFIFYMTKFPSYAIIYGAFATIPIFLIWLYICWFIILFGAMFAYEVANPKKQKISHK